ncbi:MAG TPA: N-acetyltransferase [Aequorivita sp.]|nr:N-acetyltransferase [Aequorivita sp.]
MIKKLQNSNIEISKNIFFIFQVSYAIEAELLNITDFPPLKRTLENYINSSTEFFGYFKNQNLAGVIEIDNNNNNNNNNKFTHINSLVVDPKFFRQGIARKLMEFVFETFDSDLFVVETGLENGPAIKLYNNLGFKEVNQWNTDHGIRKVKFDRRINN